MNEMIPDKKAYQSNRRIMCYIALVLMAMTTVATIWDPVRMAHADGAIMTQYIAQLTIGCMDILTQVKNLLLIILY